MDWNDPEMAEKYGCFDVILHQNGLRNASYKLIEKTFKSFHRLLNPGGVLIGSNINAIVREKTFAYYAEDAGFHLLPEHIFWDGKPLEGIEYRKDKKYAVCFYPTG